MARISDRFLECVFYLYPSEADADAGNPVGGCGFFVGVSLGPNLGSRLYAVTNSHVISDGNVVLRVNLRKGGTANLDTDERSWHQHPKGDDLALLPIEMDNAQHLFWHLDVDRIWTRNGMAEHDIGVGDETFSVGRFVNAEGRRANSPTARFGNIAQMPAEPIARSRHGKIVHQESFLIEARSIGGYSGAPVFAYAPIFSARPMGDDGDLNVIAHQVGPALLGVNWGYINYLELEQDRMSRSPTPESPMNSGMMAVVPSWKLLELLDLPKLREDRHRAAVVPIVEFGDLGTTPTSTAEESATTDERLSNSAETL